MRDLLLGILLSPFLLLQLIAFGPAWLVMYMFIPRWQWL